MRTYTAREMGLNPEDLRGGPAKRKSPTIKVEKTVNLKALATKAETEERASRFKLMLRVAGLPMPVREHTFAKKAMGRMWPFDFAWPNVDGDGGLALECDGGLFSEGAHVRGASILETHKKLNAAAVLRWRVLFCAPWTLCTDELVETVRAALADRTEATLAPPTKDTTT